MIFLCYRVVFKQQVVIILIMWSIFRNSKTSVPLFYFLFYIQSRWSTHLSSDLPNTLRYFCFPMNCYLVKTKFHIFDFLNSGILLYFFYRTPFPKEINTVYKNGHYHRTIFIKINSYLTLIKNNKRVYNVYDVTSNVIGIYG